MRSNHLLLLAALAISLSAAHAAEAKLIYYNPNGGKTVGETIAVPTQNTAATNKNGAVTIEEKIREIDKTLNITNNPGKLQETNTVTNTPVIATPNQPGNLSLLSPASGTNNTSSNTIGNKTGGNTSGGGSNLLGGGRPRAINDPTYMGAGCSTAYSLDQDCDGYGIGRSEALTGDPSTVGQPNHRGFPEYTPSLLLHTTPDANPHDPTINTTASVVARYGNLSNMNNFKEYLASLGYNNVHDIYFVSKNGNNATAQKNDPSRPYLNTYPIGISAPQILQPGDAVVYRGGVYPKLKMEGHEGGVPWTLYGLEGTSNARILLIAYPGEAVTFTSSLGGLDFEQNTKHVVLDGFRFSGHYGTGNSVDTNNYANQVARLNDIYLEDITVKNYEISNAVKWGVFGTIRNSGHPINGLTFSEGSVHDIWEEHGFYFNDFYLTPTHETNQNIRIEKSLIYYCGRNGIQMRGSNGSVVDSNVIHSNALNGIDTHNDVRNITISNNLVFNNGHAAVILFEDSNPIRNGGGIDNIRIINNTLAAKTGSNGIGWQPDTSTFPAIHIAHETANTPFNNVLIANNALLTLSNHEAIYLTHGLDLPFLTVKHNLFYGNGNGTRSLGVCGYADGSQTSISPVNPCNIGVSFWDFSAMQNNAWRPLFTENQYNDPHLTDVNLYNNLLTPWMNDFYPEENSPLINNANMTLATVRDVRGATRFNNADIGAIELQNPNNLPMFVNLTPSTFSNQAPTNIILHGGNLSTPGEVTRIKFSDQIDPNIWGYAFEDICHTITPTAISCIAPAGLMPGTYDLRIIRNNWRSEILPFTITGAN